jgi:alkyl hydroperoxide reductase subunit F
MRQKVESAGNTVIKNNSQVRAVLGGKFVEKIKVVSQAKEEEIFVQGVFVEAGLIPNSGFIKDVEKNSRGEIKINSHNETNIPGIFAAGDVTDTPEKQIIIAAGEGSKASLGAFNYLSRN